MLATDGITGNSLGMLSSLLKFGLLTGRGDNTSVSDLALQIIAHPGGSDERRAAILEAAFSPKLFAEIRDHFKNGKPSDAALRAYLLTRKFLPGAVDGVLRAYRETMALVETECGGYSAVKEELASKPQEQRPMQQHAHTPRPAQMVIQPSTPVFERAESQNPFKVTFTGSSIEIVGRIVSEADADALIKAVSALKLLLQSPTRVQYPETPQMQDEE